MSNLVLPLAEIPAVLRESLRSVLKAHGYQIVAHTGREDCPALRSGLDRCNQCGGFHNLQPLEGRALETLLREVGNNAAQALVSIDKSEDDANGGVVSLESYLVPRAEIL